jgi:hypothetical protein
VPKRACDAAIEVLRETNNSAVMWGDEGLLHLIAERLGWKHEAWKTSDRVLATLAKTPGELIARKTQLIGGRWVRCFHLPETIADFERPLGYTK